MRTRTPKQAARLQMLLETVDLINFAHFNMGSWLEHGEDEDEDAHEHPTNPPPLVSCGTTACLAGWATMHPGLKEQVGFKRSGSDWIIAYKDVEVPGLSIDDSVYGPHMEFYGLRSDQVRRLFYSGNPSSHLSDDEKRNILRGRIMAVIEDSNLSVAE